jgi:hypothetical protein
VSLEQLKLSSHARQRAEQRYVNFGRIKNAKSWKIEPNKDSHDTVQILIGYSKYKNVSLVVDIVSMIVVTVLIVR